ncbi:MAG: pyridoxamine 5'-phosphate oxidase [Gloeomargarita sp. GMQP_bins_120]
MNMDVANLRLDYNRDTLLTADPDPWVQFERWFAEACAAPIREPNAMTLATVDEQGHPDARVVLLKGFDRDGLQFYTNLTSRKGRDLTHCPYGALVFWWEPLERQVRFRGPVTLLSADECDAYFRQRPRASQIGAWTSPQSQEIPDRQVLEDRFAQLVRQYDGQDIPRPPYWGGYRLTPHWIEFWQGRPSRLHDRIAYDRQPDGTWRQYRLAP